MGKSYQVNLHVSDYAVETLRRKVGEGHERFSDGDIVEAFAAAGIYDGRTEYVRGWLFGENAEYDADEQELPVAATEAVSNPADSGKYI